jgi:hypothetical protein
MYHPELHCHPARHTYMRNQTLIPALVLAACGLLAACATPTPYQPSARGTDGYSSRKLESNRYRVTFSGNSYTSRDTVENYLLYRAAELTVQNGGDWFVVADRGTERRSQTYIDQPFNPGPYGYWGPSWRYRNSGFGWRTWSPYGRGPFWDQTVDVRTVNRYEASAEIVVRRGPKPEKNRRAFDAREVMSNLADRIKRPEPSSP